METGLCHALTGLYLLCDETPWRCPGLECIALSGGYGVGGAGVGVEGEGAGAGGGCGELSAAGVGDFPGGVYILY